MLTAQGQVEALRSELAHARDESDRLFNLVSPEALYERPIAERHRLIFYLGHLDAFDWNLVARRGLSAPAFHAEFDQLFERGIDPAPGKAREDSPDDWPSRMEVERYCARTRAWIDAHIDDVDPWLLQMAVEHRHMHAETFAYLMHGLPYHKKLGATAHTPDRESSAAPNLMVTIEAGRVVLGKNRDTFGWDNEFLEHEVFVPRFRISKFKVSNGEYLEFVREGGAVPHFWRCDNGRWLYRGMFAEFPLPMDWPVWTTWEQAATYAAWRGFNLPSEAQFQIAAQEVPPDAIRDNFDFKRWDPIPVDAGGSDEPGPRQMTGNGWEWTRDLFEPFAGFEAHPAYPGYSADFFDRDHYVLKGASPRTARMLTRPSFRNWFRPDYPHMYAGFRLVESRND
ncbi:MAG TPA: SUMF1/EgtB/PvdO family nonheme iron enzyme [Bryobacteraceae bacterium]|nr:SUMF1/EgtB/PvdO family nonheme iron enzyme [Bryobacteraceae bacterium]